MATLTRTKPTATVTLESYPPFAEATAKMQDLQAKQAAINGQLDDLNSRLLNDKNLPHGNPADEAARQLLGGAERETRASLREQCRKLQGDLNIIDRACKLHQPTVDAARTKAAYLVRQSVQPAHKAAGREIAAAVEQLIAALAAEAEIRDQLDNMGIEFGGPLQPLALPLAGNPTGKYEDRFDRLKFWLAETVEYRK